MRIYLLLQSLIFLSATTFAAETCPENVGYFAETKQAFEKDAKLNAKKVKCLALAGDDRAATLYAEYLLEKYNNNGYKEDVYASYAWYRIAIDRSITPGSWKKMPKILEGAVPGIADASKELYQQIQKQIAPKRRFDKPTKIVLPEESEKDRKSRIRKQRESGGPRVPSHRQ